MSKVNTGIKENVGHPSWPHLLKKEMYEKVEWAAVEEEELLDPEIIPLNARHFLSIVLSAG